MSLPKLSSMYLAIRKFGILRDLALMVGTGSANSLMVCGPGGMGKSFTVCQILNDRQIPYVILRGFASPAAFYNFLYRHRQELIVIDDCDSVFKDITGVNILKAVLETSVVRTVAWETSSSVIDASRFEFMGRIIFLTNLSDVKLSDHMNALLSRLHFYEFILQPDEVLGYVKHLALVVEYKGIAKVDRLKIVRFLKDMKEQIPHLNLRHYMKCMDLFLFTRTKWRTLFKACMGVCVEKEDSVLRGEVE